MKTGKNVYEQWKPAYINRPLPMGDLKAIPFVKINVKYGVDE